MNFPIGKSYKATMFVLVFVSVMFFVAVGTKEFFQKDKPDVQVSSEVSETESILSAHDEYYLKGTDDEGNTVFYKYRTGEAHNGPVEVLTKAEFIAMGEQMLAEDRKRYKKSH